MRRNKPGLADLKELRRKADAPEPAVAAPRPERIARKRAPFLPPSDSKPIPAERRGPGQAPQGRPAGGRSSTGQPHTSRPSANEQTAAGPGDPASRLSDEDRKLFRSAVRYVEKIRDPGRVLLAPVATAHASILKERRMRAAGQDAAPAGERERKPSALRETTDSPARTAPSRRLSDTFASAASHQDDSQYLKRGHGTDIIQDLKRGKWPIGASLDLHGSTLEDARERFERFLASCLTHDIKCVRIVHGKGYGSRDGDAVLKTAVRRWLTQIEEVVAYTECAEADGGSGAVQVLLK